MILSDQDLKKLIEENQLIVEPFILENVKSVHIDLRLSRTLLKYTDTIDLKNKNNSFEEIIIPESGYTLLPGDFVIGSTLESVTIPNGYFGFIETKGNVARAGLQSHNTDGHIDPGFSGTITLEIKNNANQSVIIYPEIAFVQIFIFKCTSNSTQPYQGKYQKQTGPTVYLP